MPNTRREFLQATLAAGAAAAFAPGLIRAARADARPGDGQSRSGLRILILGGTGFLGPETVDAARARGHTVTLFNRGKTERLKGGNMFPEGGVEQLHGNRDPEKRADDADEASPRGLDALKGREWDVVIDNSGYYPRMVRASAELLAPAAKQYIFISSVSAYAKNDIPGQDESAPVATVADPTVETMGASFENYGGFKAMCENVTRDVFKDRATIVRPGYIVGPGDPTDRFTYWPVRADRGGEMIAPGSPEDPIQVIDVRDLAAFLVRLAESRAGGTFTAVGPEKPLRWGDVVAACVDASSSKPSLAWIPGDFITEHAGPEGGGFPIWVPPTGEYAGFHRWKNDKARAAGLTFRAVSDTVKDTLAWHKTRPAERQAKLRAGPSEEEEAALLAKWKAREKK